MITQFKVLLVFIGFVILGLLVAPSKVATQGSSILYGYTGSAAQPIKSTSNSLWVKVQSGTGGPFTVLQLTAFTFANRASILTANGMVGYCSDCTIANPTAGGGTGAIVKLLNSVYVGN